MAPRVEESELGVRSTGSLPPLQVAGVFRTYLLQKSFVCLIFATMVSLLLLAL